MPKAAQLGVGDVLHVVQNVFHIDGTVHGREYKMLCPAHLESSPSADVNIVTGLWSCFSCGAKGDLAHLGATVLKIPREEVIDLLKPDSAEAVQSSVKRKIELARTEAGSQTVRKRPYGRLPSPREYDAGPLTYMRNRGFDRATLRRWCVRFCDEDSLLKEDGKPFTITNTIAIPVKNAKDEMVAWCYRATERSGSWQPKVLYTPGFDLSGNWFGMDHHHDEDEIFVVEGPLDAMWLDQHGVPAIAMMGSGQNNPRKFRMLHKFKRVTIFPDYDSAGTHMVETLGSLLRGQVPVYVCRWPKGVVRRTEKEKPDPQDIRRAEDLKLVVSRAIPWGAWNLRRMSA